MRHPSTPDLGEHVEFIETQQAFDQRLPQLLEGRQLAIDTEAASFHRYHDRVYLLQVSSRTETLVVDPLAVGDLGLLGEALADRQVEVVFHDADYDLRLLERQYAFRAARLFDTRVAAQLLDEPGIGLAALLEKHLGVALDKRFQRADWSQRPLTTEMLRYAATDTMHLLELRDRLAAALDAAGRLAWAEEEFALLEQVRWTEGDDEPAWLRMKGAKALRPRELATLRELHGWRDELAQRLDRAAFRILNNEPLLAIAKALPADLDALRGIAGIGPETLTRRGAQLLAAVERARALPEQALPRVERPPRRSPDLVLEARVERLKQRRNALAPALGLQPGVLCPNGTLEAIARLAPTTLEELATVPGLRTWQRGAIGRELLDVIPEPAPAGGPADPQ
ncbi:MAG: HRDC domain-containing protein [Gemmatimonadales bacterium]|jgi:ribonuclease D|nr:HRDC domain-containing protein [Gemmatimonadales bacterium]